MGRKQPDRKVAVKAARAKSAVRKKTVRKAARKPAGSGQSSKRAVRPAAKPRNKAVRKVSLGRPRVPVDARLDLVFQKDYQAREVFEFLGVETIRELEGFGPAEIIEKLTAPMVQTVQRIRKALALCNRALAGDQAFAAEFKAEFARRR
jgi:hypothetical protein